MTSTAIPQQTSAADASRISRRHFLSGVAALSALPLSVRALAAGTSAQPQEAWVSAQGAGSRHFAMSWINPASSSATTALSGFRGHGAAQHPHKPWLMVLYSRSPGTHGMVVDIRSGNVVQRFDSAEGHHMHGHGAFTPDGQLMFSTESDYRSGTGKLVIRETEHYQIVGEYLTHGTGPHQMLLMPDQKTLVVANGGLRTHPDSGRKILNADRMDSSLVYIDAASGELLGQYRLAESKASIRHLDVADDGTVAVATQVQRPAMSDNHLVNLGAVHKPGQPELVPLTAPQTLMTRFNDYMGSVAINSRERIAGFTSPRGDLAAFWNIDSGELTGYHAFHDVCGLTTTLDQRYFVLSNSYGEIRQINALTMKEEKSRRMKFSGMHWDNHLFTVKIPQNIA
ncbi:MAG: DUF1513 domain-containing protein [Pseudomonadota bacterium]|nr:DUF1513 domain-containing protein [Pseudomonadota bacterium]